MTNDLLLPLLGALVLANLVLAAVFVLPWLARRRAAAVASAGAAGTAPRAAEPVDVALQAAYFGARETSGGMDGLAFDRVARVAGLLFLGAAAIVVWASQHWPDTQLAITALLVAGLAGVFLVHDLLPLTSLAPARQVLEAVAAIALVTGLVALTGGVASPFFFGYYAIMVGGALVARPMVTFALAAAISAAYLGLLAVEPGTTTLSVGQLTGLGLELIGLWLLSYLVSIISGEQRRTRDAAVRLWLRDPLTRLFNRNYFFAVADREVRRARRTGRGFCLLMVDMDNLKGINDTFGHFFGDRMLREVADVIATGIRGIDTAARYGGDEFVVLLPETDPTGGLVVAEKLRRGIAAIRLTSGSSVIHTSVSVGVVSFPDDGTDLDRLMVHADAAMYEAKAQGRDRVVSADELRGPPPPRPSARRRPWFETRSVRARPAALTPAKDIAPSRQPPPLRRAPRPLWSWRRRSPARPGVAIVPLAPAALPAVNVPAASGAPAAEVSAPAGARTRREARPAAATTRGRRAATAAEGAESSPAPKAAGAAPERGRRFRVVHHDDAHFERTIRQFISRPEPTDRQQQHPPDVDDQPA